MKWLRRLSLLLLALLVLLWLSPAQSVLVKAMLFGPNALVPQGPPHTLSLVEHGPPGERVVHVVVRPGTVFHGRITSPALHERRTSYLIYLPPGYTDPANGTRCYPVLYLLHAAPGQPSDWTDVRLEHGPRDVRLLIADNPSDGRYYAQALAFARELAFLDIPHQVLIQPAPPLLGHYWPYWHEAIPAALIFVSQNLGR